MNRLSLILFPCILIGCGSTNPIAGDAKYRFAGSAAGGALAYGLSDGDPLISAAGTAGGLLLTEGIIAADKKQERAIATVNYNKGGSDAAKRLREVEKSLHQPIQEQNQQSGSWVEYPVTVPAQTVDGVQLEEETKVLRFYEKP